MMGECIALTKRVNVTVEVQKVRDAVERWNKRAASRQRDCLTVEEVTGVLTTGTDVLYKFFLYAYGCDVDYVDTEDLIMYSMETALDAKEGE
jgi:hypothetical protein